MKFRNKPIVIEATQWFKMGDHPAVIVLWSSTCTNYEGKVFREDIDYGLKEYKSVGSFGYHGEYFVTSGDYILDNADGSHLHFKQYVFEEIYERVEDKNEN